MNGVPDLGLTALELAPALLGHTLVRLDADGRRRAGVIVETEAYPGGEDLASHSRRGHRSPRNESMYLSGGHLYVYLIYGMHHCLNIVSGGAGQGEAVLIRAIRPTEGLDAMRSDRKGIGDRDLARGPGRLCRALDIDRSFDGLPLEGAGPVRLESGDVEEDVICTTRIGIDGAGDWAARPWRFLAGDRRWWSAPPPAGSSRRPC